MSQKEVEFESGEFEDIKENEMEDFNHGSESQNIFINSLIFIFCTFLNTIQKSVS